LKGALASKDPTLILAAGPLLTARYLEYELRLPDGKGIEISDYSIWKSVACHYAGGCGIDSPFVKLDCAMHGRCDVSTYDELTQKYQLTEEKWQKFLEYRALLIRAIDSQDWTILNESRGRTTNLFHNMISTQSSPRFRLRVGG
jgi:hypothetical protein